MQCAASPGWVRSVRRAARAARSVYAAGRCWGPESVWASGVVSWKLGIFLGGGGEERGVRGVERPRKDVEHNEWDRWKLQRISVSCEHPSAPQRPPRHGATGKGRETSLRCGRRPN